MKTSFFLLCCATLIICGAGCKQSAQSSYAIVNRIHVDGDGGWDYCTMDESAGRLFVSHGTVVQGVDVQSGKLLGVISDMKGVHGIALASDLNKGFISSGKDSMVTIFDLKSYAVIARVKVTGENPDAILYDVPSHRVFAFNGRTENATVIDAATNAIVGTIALDGRPEFAVSDDKGTVFVNLEDKNMVCAIDPIAMTVKQRWSVAPGEEPSGLAIDVATNRLFIVCGNKLMVIVDAQNGNVLTSLPIGDRVDGVAFDPGTKRAYSSNGEGTVTVVQEENDHTFKVLENIATQKGAKTIAVDTKTHHLYLPTADFGATPEPTTEHPKPRPPVMPGTFVILDLATK